jgi:DNA-3-methyladenine glycosylase II
MPPQNLADLPELKKGFRLLLKQDPVFRRYKFKDLHWTQEKADFAALVGSITSQQLSVKAAATIYNRVVELCDGHLKPDIVLQQKEKDLRQCGLSYQKISYLMSLAEHVKNKSLKLRSLKNQSDQDIIDQITSVKGFGAWSAQMFLIFALGRPDIWPIHDLGVQEGARLYDEILLKKPTSRPSAKELNIWGDRFKPYRSCVALLLWKLKGDQAVRTQSIKAIG